MDIVFKNSRLIDCREIPKASQVNGLVESKWETNPRVKTLSSEVLPLAPSPLRTVRAAPDHTLLQNYTRG